MQAGSGCSTASRRTWLARSAPETASVLRDQRGAVPARDDRRPVRAPACVPAAADRHAGQPKSSFSGRGSPWCCCTDWPGSEGKPVQTTLNTPVQLAADHALPRQNLRRDRGGPGQAPARSWQSPAARRAACQASARWLGVTNLARHSRSSRQPRSCQQSICCPMNGPLPAGQFDGRPEFPQLIRQCPAWEP